MAQDKLGICLWYDGQAEDAARLYCDLFHGAKLGEIVRAPLDWPGGEKGSVITVDFTAFGQTFLALNGGSGEGFTNAMSVQIFTDTQEETDRYYDGLVADGGEAMPCSWCCDRFGVSWQIVPRILREGLQHSDADVRKRVNEAMFTMTKIDHAQIEAAIAGE